MGYLDRHTVLTVHTHILLLIHDVSAIHRVSKIQGAILFAIGKDHR